MYNFTDLNGSQLSEKILPSVAMNFNGTFIENVLEGYQTLTISGRETTSVELANFDVKKGSITTNTRLPSRTIVVKYLLQGNDNNSFQKKFKELRKLLHSVGQKEIYFADEPDAFYFGQLSDMNEVPAESNSVVGTFSIHCDSPYKFGSKIETAGIVSIETFYETQPDLIRLTLSAATSVVRVTNGTQTIQLNGFFSQNDSIEIEVQRGFVRRNGVDYVYTVSLNSDFENFLIKKGETVSSVQGSLRLIARERWL